MDRVNILIQDTARERLKKIGLEAQTLDLINQPFELDRSVGSLQSSQSRGT